MACKPVMHSPAGAAAWRYDLLADISHPFYN